MTQNDSLKALQQLKAEVAALKAAQKAAPLSDGDELEKKNLSADKAQETSPAQDSVSTPAKLSEEEQLDELKTLLAKEIKDLPTVTTLAVFSLGLLMGRYLR